MIVEKITQWDRVIVNKCNAQIYVKKLRVKDTDREVCKEMAATFLLFEPVFGKTADRKTIIYCYLLAQRAKIIINFHLRFEHVQTTW